MARPRLTRFARLPIRIRLTIAFAAAMAAVLGTAGAVVYAQFRHDLDGQIDSGLRGRLAEAMSFVDAGGGPRAIGSRGDRYSQLYSADGRVLATTRAPASFRLLTRQQVRRALAAPLAIRRTHVPDGDVRVRAAAARQGRGRMTVVAVGDALDRRDDALHRLAALLLIAGPIALVLASSAGYALARAALRPVDRMRTQAEQLTEGRLTERLSVPETRDEVAALGRTFNALLGRVEAAVARDRQLVSDASHELRTPLTVLRAEVDLALRGDRDPAELRAALEAAATEAKRMTRLSDDLLVLARADQGRLPLDPQTIAAGDLLEAAASRARAAAGQQGRAVVVSAGDSADGPAVLADPDRAAQALDNLVGNALRYGAGTISLTSRTDADVVVLHVTDEGGGFPHDVIDRAFERFARGADAQARGSGSGLGLALVDAVARAHGGHAQARNRPEGGADVSIALPRA
jgi:two-component system OmpR family sensor kinase